MTDRQDYIWSMRRWLLKDCSVSGSKDDLSKRKRGKQHLHVDAHQLKNLKLGRIG